MSSAHKAFASGPFARIEPLLNGVAVLILATQFLLWELSRASFLLLSLAALIYVMKYRPQLPRVQRLYSWPIIVYFAAMFLAVAYDGFTGPGINKLTSRFFLLLIAIPLVSLFFVSFDPKRNPWTKFVTGTLVMGVLALVDVLILDKYRAGGGHNEAVFGFGALAMTTIVLASYHRFKNARFGMAFYLSGLAMGFCAMFLSGTRSGWIAGIVVIVIAMIFYLDRYSLPKRIFISIVLICAIAAAGLTVPLVQQRVDNMVEIVTPYLRGEEQTEFNSLRHRVEAWKAAWTMGMSHKVFGIGPGNFKKSLRAYVRENPHLGRLQYLSHAHNQYMQTFATSGFIGLGALLVLILGHLWLFARYLGRNYSEEVRSLALAGFMLVIAYAIYSIPAVPFYGRHSLMTYAFSTASIWGCLLGALQGAKLSAPSPAV